MVSLFLDGEQRNLLVRTLDYFLYFATFGGITFISGSIVHALQFSLFSVFLVLLGMVMTPGAIIIRDKLSKDNQGGQPKTFETYVVTVVTSVSAGIVAGGILHWQESPRFGLYLVLTGLIMSLISNLLYSTKDLKFMIRDYLIGLAMFSGISFISGSVVHAMNAWFSNFSLIIIGLVLTPGALIIKKKMVMGGVKVNLWGNAIILIFLSLGIGGITGGVLHFNINMTYATKLIIAGFIISYLASLFKTRGSLAELRN